MVTWERNAFRTNYSPLVSIRTIFSTHWNQNAPNSQTVVYIVHDYDLLICIVLAYFVYLWCFLYIYTHFILSIIVHRLCFYCIVIYIIRLYRTVVIVRYFVHCLSLYVAAGLFYIPDEILLCFLCRLDWFPSHVVKYLDLLRTFCLCLASFYYLQNA